MNERRLHRFEMGKLFPDLRCRGFDGGSETASARFSHFFGKQFFSSSLLLSRKRLYSLFIQKHLFDETLNLVFFFIRNLTGDEKLGLVTVGQESSFGVSSSWTKDLEEN